MSRAASTRLEFRIRPDAKKRIQQAADLLAVPVGDFVRSAAEAEAEVVIKQSGTTEVPADFFDSLMVALDEPAKANPVLARASARRRTVAQPR